MNEDQFWNLIANAKSASDGDTESHLEAIKGALVELTAEEIVGFEKVFGELKDKAFHWDLWAAAYIIGGGCSDDAFMDFRNWLILSGQSVYERALLDAESLAELDLGPDADMDVFVEEFAYLASEVYEEKTGIQMPYPDRDFPADPIGEPWEEDGDDLKQRFPRLWSKLSDS